MSAPSHMAFSFRSQHSSDRKHEYGAVITTDKGAAWRASVGGGEKEERYCSLLQGCSSLRKGGDSTHSPLSLPVTGAQDATKVKMETIHH